jgi:hypothetical protein
MSTPIFHTFSDLIEDPLKGTKTKSAVTSILEPSFGFDILVNGRESTLA